MDDQSVSWTCLVIRHSDHQTLGSFEPILRQRGWTIDERLGWGDLKIADHGSGDPAGAPGLLVVLGGPVSAMDDRRYPWLKPELSLIERWLRDGRPILGIGLGAHLMVRALGGRIYRGNVREIGWAPVILSEEGRSSPLRVFGDAWPVFHWHADTFDPPAGTAKLALTATYRNQAFARGATQIGLQFHAEAAATEIERWLVAGAHDLFDGRVDPEPIRTGAVSYGGGLASRAGRWMNDWLAGVEHQAA